MPLQRRRWLDLWVFRGSFSAQGSILTCLEKTVARVGSRIKQSVNSRNSDGQSFGLVLTNPICGGCRTYQSVSSVCMSFGQHHYPFCLCACGLVMHQQQRFSRGSGRACMHPVHQSFAIPALLCFAYVQSWTLSCILADLDRTNIAGIHKVRVSVARQRCSQQKRLYLVGEIT